MITLWLSTLLACGDLTTQDTWELIGINQDLSVVDLQITTGNTGVLKGAGRLRFDWLFRDQTPILFGRDGLPEEVVTPEGGGLRVGPDGLTLQSDGTWRLDVQDVEAQARLTFAPQIGGPAPLTWQDGDKSWTVETPVVFGDLGGFVNASGRQALVEGRAVLTHRHGDAPPALAGTEQLAVYILGDGLSIGHDETGVHATSWAVVGEYLFDARDARLIQGEKGRLVLDLRPTADLVAHVLPRKPRSVRRPWDHLHALERWLLKAWHGTPVRRTQGGRANVLIGGDPLEARAVIVATTWE